jgi:exodeoxyribonuclease VII small subunit
MKGRKQEPMKQQHDAGALEASLDRLDAIAVALERDDLELEQALALFEEGIAHLRGAERILRDAELRVERLLAGQDGTLVAEPLEGEER